jgi:hypothetical protein
MKLPYKEDFNCIHSWKNKETKESFISVCGNCEEEYIWKKFDQDGDYRAELFGILKGEYKVLFASQKNGYLQILVSKSKTDLSESFKICIPVECVETF